MRDRTVLSFTAFLSSLALAAISACGSSSSNESSDDGGPDAASSSSGGGSSGGGSSSGSGSSGSSSGGMEGGLPMGMQIGTPPTPMDGGVYCPAAFGAMAACAAPQVCCWGDQSQVPAPMAGCTGASACTGSVVACSGTSQCSTGQVCCFAFTGDAGATGLGPSGPFAAQCATSCPEGDMVHYRLCTSGSDCSGGQICNNMAPYSPYCVSTGGVDGGTGDGAVDGGSSTDASDASSPSDASDASEPSDGAADAGPG